MKFRHKIHSFEVVAFVTGFALLAFELVASRILAPTIGSSIYIWTSVIGVIIAALSLGYAFGGILADKRVAPADIAWLLLASAGGILVTLIMSDEMLSIISSSISDSRLQGVLASILLFLPASFLMGMISPYLVRLYTTSISTTGRSVALLSALNSVGGILGTFCVGFVFFAYIGSRETLLLLIIMLIATSWLILPRVQTKGRLITTSALLLFMVLGSIQATSPRVLAAIDTPSAHYEVLELHRDNRPLRAIATGPGGLQSGVYLDNPDELAFSYTKKIAGIIEQAEAKRRILILGGGTFTLPQYLAKEYPSSEVTVVEIDPELLSIAREYFYFADQPNLTVRTEDARTFMNTNQQQYDVIVLDVFSDTTLPFALTTSEFAQRLEASLTQNGFVAANVIGAVNKQCAPLLTAVHRTFTLPLPAATVFPLVDPTLQRKQNSIIVYAKEEPKWLDTAGSTDALKPTGTILTDNFAPIERLTQQCKNG